MYRPPNIPSELYWLYGRKEREGRGREGEGKGRVGALITHSTLILHPIGIVCMQERKRKEGKGKGGGGKCRCTYHP